jgi:hypothetical protein
MRDQTAGGKTQNPNLEALAPQADSTLGTLLGKAYRLHLFQEL